MTEPCTETAPSTTWYSLNASYQPVAGTPADMLLDDATLILDYARSLARVLAQALNEESAVDPTYLAEAFNAMAVLMDLALTAAAGADRPASQSRRAG
ncbi:hypothetical protein GCM10009090_35970 [[Pseudomonas] boreopolis]|uniref:DUF3077 domain-containing protein n=2 Tax=Xanthomonas boreopolis TaxID=86183 RepID=A0A919FCG9_9XANT|nr:hypothetical protein GCM10009090_35970 [[Pseudomonas] boreopolis]